MMKRDLRFSRRNLLKTIGAGAALLPLLESDPADAQCLAGGIKRLYILCWPDGMLSSINSWSPAGTDPSNWKLAPFQESLAPFQKDLLLLNGIDYKFIRDMPGSGERTGHACYQGMLTGAWYKSLGSTSQNLAGGPSIDQFIGTKLKAGGYGGLVSLNQGAFVQSTARLSWSGAGQPIVPDFDPYHVFKTSIQGNIKNPGVTPPGPTPPAPVDHKKAVQKSILDAVINDLKRFSNVVGAADKASIDAHLGFVRSIEGRLDGITNTGIGSGDGVVTNGIGAACGVPAAATAAAVAFADYNNIPTISKLHMDLTVAAFAADLTRVGVMQIGDQGAARLILSWSPYNFKDGGADTSTGDINGFHAIAHRNAADKVRCDGWFQSQIAYVIGQMKSIVDPTGKSMLDSSVVVAMNNMRTGTHETTDVPVVMAGSCGGYFKTGRSLALPKGTPNNALLVALCNAMGTPTETFGEKMYGGELTALKG